MSNDIVTRLLGYCDCVGEKLCFDCEISNEIKRLRGLLMIFDDHFVCEECDKACATYLQGCPNPLHALHTAAWEIR